MDRDSTKAVSVGEATLTAYICFALGVLLSAGLATGGDFPFKCLEKGNIADWLAAGGTWVIGFGAWKYAREAHLLRERELQQGAERDRHLHAGRVQAIREWGKIIRRPLRVTRQVEDDRGSLTVGSVRGAIRGASALIKLIPLDDEAWRYLSRDDVELKIRLATLGALLETQGQAVLERIKHAKSIDPVETIRDSLWSSVRGTMEDLDKLGIALDEAATRVPPV